MSVVSDPPPILSVEPRAHGKLSLPVVSLLFFVLFVSVAGADTTSNGDAARARAMASLAAPEPTFMAQSAWGSQILRDPSADEIHNPIPWQYMHQSMRSQTNGFPNQQGFYSWHGRDSESMTGYARMGQYFTAGVGGGVTDAQFQAALREKRASVRFVAAMTCIAGGMSVSVVQRRQGTSWDDSNLEVIGSVSHGGSGVAPFVSQGGIACHLDLPGAMFINFGTVPNQCYADAMSFKYHFQRSVRYANTTTAESYAAEDSSSVDRGAYTGSPSIAGCSWQLGPSVGALGNGDGFRLVAQSPYTGSMKAQSDLVLAPLGYPRLLDDPSSSNSSSSSSSRGSSSGSGSDDHPGDFKARIAVNFEASVASILCVVRFFATDPAVRSFNKAAVPATSFQTYTHTTEFPMGQRNQSLVLDIPDKTTWVSVAFQLPRGPSHVTAINVRFIKDIIPYVTPTRPATPTLLSTPTASSLATRSASVASSASVSRGSPTLSAVASSSASMTRSLKTSASSSVVLTATGTLAMTGSLSRSAGAAGHGTLSRSVASVTVTTSLTTTASRTTMRSGSLSLTCTPLATATWNGTLSAVATSTKRRSATATHVATPTAVRTPSLVPPEQQEPKTRPKVIKAAEGAAGTATVGAITAGGVSAVMAGGSGAGGALGLQRVAAMATMCSPFDADDAPSVFEHPLRFAVGTSSVRYPVGAALGAVLLFGGFVGGMLLLAALTALFLQWRASGHRSSVAAFLRHCVGNDRASLRRAFMSQFRRLKVAECSMAAFAVLAPMAFEQALTAALHAGASPGSPEHNERAVGLAVCLLVIALPILAAFVVVPTVRDECLLEPTDAVVSAAKASEDRRRTVGFRFDPTAWASDTLIVPTVVHDNDPLADLEMDLLAPAGDLDPAAPPQAQHRAQRPVPEWWDTAPLLPRSAHRPVPLSLRTWLRTELWPWLWDPVGEWRPTADGPGRAAADDDASNGDSPAAKRKCADVPAALVVYGPLFVAYRRPWHWFIAVEAGSALAIAGIAAFSSYATVSWSCVASEIAAASVASLLLVLVVILRPHLAPGDAMLAVVGSLLEVTAAVCRAAGASDEAVAGLLLVLGLFTMLQMIARVVHRVVRRVIDHGGPAAVLRSLAQWARFQQPSAERDVPSSASSGTEFLVCSVQGMGDQAPLLGHGPGDAAGSDALIQCKECSVGGFPPKVLPSTAPAQEDPPGDPSLPVFSLLPSPDAAPLPAPVSPDASPSLNFSFTPLPDAAPVHTPPSPVPAGIDDPLIDPLDDASAPPPGPVGEVEIRRTELAALLNQRTL